MFRVQSQNGFSLIELVVVVVLLGVLASGAGLLITRPLEAYDAQVRRQLLVDQAAMALGQMTREIRGALPNSLRVTAVGTGVTVELVPTIDGARYRDQGGLGYILPEHRLEFSAADDSFNLLGSFSAYDAPPALTLPVDNRLVIYNTTANQVYIDAASNSNPGIITTAGTSLQLVKIDSAPQDSEHNITMTPAFQFDQQSPGQRVFIVSDPVSYYCNPVNGELTRHTDYGFTAAQPAPPAGTSSLIATNLSSCQLTYAVGVAQRDATLSVEISLSNSGESVDLLHQIHVINLP